MHFNYRSERNRFEREWIEKVRQFRDAGMNCSQINAMYEYDWALFRAERNYCGAVKGFLSEEKFCRKYEQGTEDQYFQNLLFDLDVLLDDLSPGLSAKATQRDKEVILLSCMGRTQEEIASTLGISHQVVSRHLIKIKNFFEKGGAK